MTDGEARAGGRVKPFGSSGNESLKGGLWYWWKWIEIFWKRKEEEFAQLRGLKGTTRAWHRTPRLVLEGNCCVQIPPERQEGTLVLPRLLHWQLSATRLWVSPRSSSSVGVSLGFPVRWEPNSKQMLPKDSGWKSSCSFFQAVLSTCKNVIHCKENHLFPTHDKTEKPVSADKTGGGKLLQLQLPVGSSM